MNGTVVRVPFVEACFRVANAGHDRCGFAQRDEFGSARRCTCYEGHAGDHVWGTWVRSR